MGKPESLRPTSSCWFVSTDRMRCCIHVPTTRDDETLLKLDSSNDDDDDDKEEEGTEQIPCSLLLVSSLVRMRIHEGSALVAMG